MTDVVELIPERVRGVMTSLEARDARDRVDGTPHGKRLRAIAPDVGRLLAGLILAGRSRLIVEVGTSGGYSTLWLAIAAARTGGRVITYEIDPEKAKLARATFAEAGVQELVDLRESDGVAALPGLAGTADLVFVDAEKRDYLRMLEPAILALRSGGWLVADNLVSHEDELVGFRDAALADPRLVGLVVPVGGGELLAVRL